MAAPETKGDVEFTPKGVMEHLDQMIEFWRNKNKTADKDSEDELVAMCYVDAYQCIYKNLFNELKP